MGIFSSKGRNRKRRTPAKKRNPASWKEEATAPRKGSAKSAKQQQHKLHAQINSLENFLSKKSVEHERQLRMRSMNILPPPDNSRKNAAKRKMSAAQKRKHLAHRNQSGLRFLTLFLIACGIVWYLLKTGL